MSMNLVVYAKRDILVLKTGEKTVQTIRNRNIWQTPTTVTRSILAAEDKKQAYIDWCRSLKLPADMEPFYDPEDMFCDGPIIGYEEVNETEEHIIEFMDWVDICEEAGYEIIYGER